MQVFIWPWLLATLVVVPLLLWLYRRAQRRPAEAVLLHSDLAQLAMAARRGRRWTRHLPAALYLVAIAIALVALARPTVATTEPDPHAGIMLALDVSLSMRATDVAPSRIAAAQQALKAFVRELPSGTRVGLVTFAAYATTMVPLTDDHERLLDAVGAYNLGRGTVIGDALLESVAAFPDVAERRALGGDPRDYAAIVLLSDGSNRGGVEPLVALREVQEQEVTVHAIGVGSEAAKRVPVQSALRFDEETMQAIAEGTGGRYAFVDSAEALHDVYLELSSALAWRVRRDEATALASLAAAAALVASLCAAWLRRGL